VSRNVDTLALSVAGIPVIELVSEVVGIPGTELVPIVEQELPTLPEHHTKVNAKYNS
jgi:hypothetical protein